MKLIDIILESKASEEAKRLGLVKKAGFGLYGPPGDNNPATHASRGGKLAPIGGQATSGIPQNVAFNATDDYHIGPGSNPFAHQPDWEKIKKQDAAARARAAKMPDLPKEPPSPEEVAKVEERMARRKTAPPTTRVAPLVARILQALPDRIIKDPKIPVAVISQYYGRTDVPQIYMADDLKKKIKPDHAIVSDAFRRYRCVGIYLSDIDGIGVTRTIDKRTPMSQWEPELAGAVRVPTNSISYRALHTLVHEAIHGVSRDVFTQETTKFKRDARGIAINEGLTEVMAQSIMSGLMENDSHYEKMNLGDPDAHTYPEFTRAIRLLEEFGGLDIDFLIRNHNEVDEQGESVVLVAVGKAQTQTMQTILTDAGLESSKIDEILELIQKGWASGKYLLSNSEVSTTLRGFVNNTSEIDDVARNNLYETLLRNAQSQATS
jgi:hypothetical protein